MVKICTVSVLPVFRICNYFSKIEVFRPVVLQQDFKSIFPVYLVNMYRYVLKNELNHLKV
jgi:hypothetical protein